MAANTADVIELTSDDEEAATKEGNNKNEADNSNVGTDEGGDNKHEGNNTGARPPETDRKRSASQEGGTEMPQPESVPSTSADDVAVSKQAKWKADQRLRDKTKENNLMQEFKTLFLVPPLDDDIQKCEIAKGVGPWEKVNNFFDAKIHHTYPIDKLLGLPDSLANSSPLVSKFTEDDFKPMKNTDKVFKMTTQQNSPVLRTTAAAAIAYAFYTRCQKSMVGDLANDPRFTPNVYFMGILDFAHIVITDAYQCKFAQWIECNFQLIVLCPDTKLA